MTLILVDDSAHMRATVRALLRGRPYAIRECADGLEAVAAYERQPADWVVMDVAMPRLDGIEATRRIYAFDSGARVVILTDYDDDTLRARAKEAGAAAYVTKDDLFQLLDILA
jgi:CheY-like chemotaxis protein